MAIGDAIATREMMTAGEAIIVYTGQVLVRGIFFEGSKFRE